MECAEVQEILDEFAAGGLPAEKADGIREHLADCANCRRLHSQYNAALGALREAGEERCTPDGAFYRGLARRLDEVDRYAGRARVQPVRWYFVGSVATAAAAVFILSVVLMPSFERKSAEPTDDVAALTAVTHDSLTTTPAQTASAEPSAVFVDASTAGSFVPVSTDAHYKAAASSQADGAYRGTWPVIYVSPRLTRPVVTLPFQEIRYVSFDDYGKLEQRLNLVETRLATLEQSGETRK